MKARALMLGIGLVGCATFTEPGDSVAQGDLERRGQYLVDLLGCANCHTEGQLFDRPVPNGYLAGSSTGIGYPNDANPGIVFPANLTPHRETGLGNWTDDEIARAIREGVSRDGTALFPVMPYLDFASMDDEDVASVVVYLRSIPAVRNVVPVRQLPFPLEYIARTIPKPVSQPQPSHPAATPEDRGKYLVTIASCGGCHTPADEQGAPMTALAFGGGARFEDPGNNMTPIFSMNITQDASGIAHYDESLFIQVLHSGQITGRMLSHIMPFEFFRNITDDDLRDMWAYLKSRPPVKHRVNNTEPPTSCPVCSQRHGFGDLNVKKAS